jgi:MPBQ/MSBQ methyltransferase
MAMASTYAPGGGAAGALAPGRSTRVRGPAGLGGFSLTKAAGARPLSLARRSPAAAAAGPRQLLRCAASSSSSSSAAAAARPVSAPRFIQHKKEAFWFYRFLSIVYDHVINPGHWTEDMRDDALEPADLYSRHLKVVDVGGGTGFTTLGIVKHVNPENVTLLDQSPHQLDKARQKEALKGVTIMEGDAEDLPFPTDTFDRYVSAGRYLGLVSLAPWYPFHSIPSVVTSHQTC